MTATATRSVGVDELRRAWLAVQDGRFRATRGTAREAHPDDRQPWRPAEDVLPIVGCVPQAGATTLALAVATVAAPARVVEYATPAASGLAAAATAELGSTDAGWTVGRRDQVHLARAGGHHGAVSELPPPDAAPDGTSLTVLDVGDHLGRLGTPSALWLSASLNAAPKVVLVTAATVPGLRRLETALALLDPARAVVAVRGRHSRRWPRELTAALGGAARDLYSTVRWVEIPHDKRLALRGIDSAPLPPSLLSAADALLRRTRPAHPSSKGRS